MHGWLLRKSEDGIVSSLGEIDPPAQPAGEVRVRVLYSSLNYKDALAMTGTPGVVRSYPMVPGIDLAGVVEESSCESFAIGDPVIAVGCGLGERYWGGYATTAWLRPEWLVPLPAAFTLTDAMTIGTAGFTAMQCVDALERWGIHKDGPIAVTGAAGGVGSIAIALLAASGYQAIASTGRTEESDYLRALGASEVIHREELQRSSHRPMESERWAGAVDTVGGDTLAGILRTLRHGGAVAACGLAGGAQLHTTVYPFILRGVSLLGINSVEVSNVERRRIWDSLAARMPAGVLRSMQSMISLEQVPEWARKILAGRVRGRVVVGVSGESFC
jgi:acrylyl-CoA reductase (NADPH)